jgi:hypothetical protein
MTIVEDRRPLRSDVDHDKLPKCYTYREGGNRESRETNLSAVIVTLSTGLTHPEDLEGVACRLVVMLLADVFFYFFNFGREELHGTAALCAYHVVMVTAIELVFVAGYAIVKSDLASQSTFGQQLQGAIDGREPDPRIFFLHQPEKFIGGEMVPRLHERAQDGIALPSMFQANFAQVFVEDVFRLPHHLARDGGLIVNAFRWMGGWTQAFPCNWTRTALLPVP